MFQKPLRSKRGQDSVVNESIIASFDYVKYEKGEPTSVPDETLIHAIAKHDILFKHLLCRLEYLLDRSCK